MAINKRFVIILSVCLVIALFGFFISMILEKPKVINSQGEGKDIIKNYELSDRVYLDAAKDTTYIDTEKAYISAKPETLKYPGWVESEDIIKDYAGPIDAIIETDNFLIVPTKLQVYNPSSQSYTFIQNCKNYSILSGVVSCYAANGSLEFQEAFIEQKENDFTIERSYIIGWQDVGIFQEVDKNFYVIKNINLEKLQSYKHRVFIDVKGKVYGKYNLAFIPSDTEIKSYLTKYPSYVLDPFVNSSGSNLNIDYLNKNMITAYGLDETGLPLRDVYRGKYNITAVAGSPQYANATAVIDNSVYFFGDDGKALFLNESVKNEVAATPSYSIVLWLYWIQSQGDSTGQRIFDDGTIILDTQVSTDKFFFFSGGKSTTSNETLGEKSWQMVTLTCAGGTWTKLYFNTTTVIDNSSQACAVFGTLRIASEATNNRNLGGNLDNLLIFNKTLNQTEINDLYNNGLGAIWNATSELPPASINVTLKLPTLYFNTTSQNVTFNCSAYELTGLSMLNLTLIIDAADNLTVFNTTANQNLSIDTSNLLTANVQHNYTCKGSVKTNSTTAALRYFTIDTQAPLVNITYPQNTTYTDNFITVNRKQIMVNWTYSDLLPSTCIFWNNTGNSTIECHDLNKTLNITYGDTNFILWANDSVGHTAAYGVSSRFNYKLFENSQTYNAVVLEGSSNLFTANVTLGSTYTISEAQLIYNSTIYTGIITASGGDYILSNTIIAPAITATVNKTFVWQLTLSDGSMFNLTSHNQTITNVSIADCGTLTKKVYNFTLLDEKDQTLVYDGVLIETAVNLYSYDQSTLVYSYSNTSTNSSLLICITKEIGTANYSLDIIVKYSSQDHTSEYYNIVNASYTNSTAAQTIILYDLNSTQNTDFQLTFTGSDFLPVENALVYINRQYIPENTFKTVELPKTDSNGQTILHLVRNERIYNFIIMKDGVILGTFNNILAFCEDFTIGNCKINLNAFTTGEEVFNYDEDIGLLTSGVVYLNATKTVSFAFATTDGNPKSVLMEVSRNDVFGNRTLCNDTLTTSSGALSCSLPSTIEDSLVIVKIYVSGREVLIDYIQIAYEGFGKGGNFLFMIFIIAFILMIGKSKNTFLIGILLGFITSILLGLIKGAIIGLGSAGIWLIVIVVIGLWKLNKNKEN